MVCTCVEKAYKSSSKKIEGSPIARDSGRPRKSIGETIKRDLEFNGLNVNMIHDRTLWLHLIHVIDPIGLVVVV